MSGGNGGYIRIYRSLLGHPAFRDWSEVGMFVGMIAQAQWKDGRVRYRDREIELKRGQLAISVRDLATKTGKTKDQISRTLKRITARNMIATATETGVNVITICNYDQYQEQPEVAATPPARRPRQDRDRTATENNKGNKGNKEKVDNPLPPWLPVEAWEGWLEMRRENKMPATDRAVALAIKQLEGWHRKGIDIEKVLDVATMSGWRGLYLPTNKNAQQDLLRHQPLTL